VLNRRSLAAELSKVEFALMESFFNSWIQTKRVCGSIAAGQILGELIDEYLVFASSRWFMDEAVQVIIRVICCSHISHVVISGY